MIWISVKDRLPKSQERVLVYDSEVNPSQAEMKYQIKPGSLVKYSPETAWWMPLPDAPPLAGAEIIPSAGQLNVAKVNKRIVSKP